MDYVNPVSIAQMAQVPKDTSLPGTGYGLMQGFNEGEAMNRAKDFLSLSQAAQAQDYAKQQFDMQSKWEDRPFELQKRQTELEGTQLNNQKTKFDIAQAHDSARKAKLMDQIHLLAAFSPSMQNAQTEIEKRAVYAQYLHRAKQFGYPLDEDLHYDPNDPESLNKIQKHFAGAYELSLYDKQFGQKKYLQSDEQQFKGKEGALDRAAMLTRNREDNLTRLKVQEMEAAIKREGFEKGAEGLAAEKGRILVQWKAIEAIPPAKRTPEQQAIAIVAEKILAGGVYNMAPAQVGERARKQTEGELQGITSGGKGDRPSTNTTVSPNGIDIRPLPQSPEIKSESIEDIVNRHLK